MTRFVAACGLADLTEGKPKACQVEGKAFTVVKSADKVYALDAVCPHRGGPLSEGFVAEGCLICPWHGWGFHLDTGMYVGSPGVGVRTHPTEVRDGAVMIDVG
jgi:nitrite reductase/ring-hydroxylating ferredoxin subunit